MLLVQFFKNHFNRALALLTTSSMKKCFFNAKPENRRILKVTKIYSRNTAKVDEYRYKFKVSSASLRLNFQLFLVSHTHKGE